MINLTITKLFSPKYINFLLLLSVIAVSVQNISCSVQPTQAPETTQDTSPLQSSSNSHSTEITLRKEALEKYQLLRAQKPVPPKQRKRPNLKNIYKNNTQSTTIKKTIPFNEESIKLETIQIMEFHCIKYEEHLKYNDQSCNDYIFDLYTKCKTELLPNTHEYHPQILKCLKNKLANFK
jgi:hypothetical protein